MKATHLGVTHVKATLLRATIDCDLKDAHLKLHLTSER